ncbi:metal-dependent hydrolase [Methanocella arvoryzae]|uniref:Membrane-bound metal-dependent hydrolase n=1 Tax=Methanocella arvoryzae (strain DSM 22066 / NBRC 105507 / MRE50) TaxID=351160 RepID=Q0W4H6_METAR|nr:metal-dependent hydrolase [Methanocella arvoryzae]CAJ36717.1 putative membrane-bound metal-dependent hydrolase [Methanocella arvoryzae MRE50]
MLFFGHIGLTLLVVFLVALALKIGVDYRLVIVGSLLPDIIDKPLGEYIFHSVFNNGRIFSHTLLFIAVLAIIALLVARKYRYWGVGVLTVSAAFHQVEDQMWNAAGTWFWPLFGWGFPEYERGDYILYLLNNLISRPDVFLPEIAGLLALGWFVLRFKLYKPENARAFVLTGRLPMPVSVKPVVMVKQ